MATGNVKGLAGRVCVVTGATRGLGKGIALQLAEAGATLYITGRTLTAPKGDAVGGSLTDTAKEIENRGGICIPVQCDHTKDDQISNLFEKIKKEQDGRLDVLVNNAFSASMMINDHLDTPFWEQPMEMWDTVNQVGLRSHYICSIHAARMMVPRQRGLIINISSGGGLSYIFNVPYGIGKEACDRMAADCAVELKKHNVTFLSLWPGAVRTENVEHLIAQGKFGKYAKMFEDGETVEYSGKAVVCLAADPNVIKKTGKICLSADLGYEYGFTDINGKQKHSLRKLKYIMQFNEQEMWKAKYVPGFIYIPKWMLCLAGNKF